MRWKGQIARIEGAAWTINKNVSLHVRGGSGLPQDFSIEASTIENPQMIGMLVTGCRGIQANLLHVYSNETQGGGKNFVGHLYDGTDSVVTEIDVRMPTVRATAAEDNYTAFAAFGTNCDLNSIRVRDIIWKQFGYAGQTRFRNIRFDPIPLQGVLAVTSGTTIALRPDSYRGDGGYMPIRRRYGTGGNSSDGEWVAVRLPQTGLSATNSGLSSSTNYNVYLYADAAAILTPRLEFSTTGTALDEHGYVVKSGDASRLFVGRVATDGSGNFATSDHGYLNPIKMSGPTPGVPAWLFLDVTERGRLAVKNSAAEPNSTVDYTYSYWPQSEWSKTWDPPSLAAGASTTTTITGVNAAMGDYVTGVSFTNDLQGMTLSAYMSALTVITVVLTNTTAGTIDLASGTLRATTQRR